VERLLGQIHEPPSRRSSPFPDAGGHIGTVNA
jgi:hypothetical protein